MASSIEQSSDLHPDDTEKSSSRGQKQAAGISAAAVSRKRAVRRGANIHIQDEDQAPTGKNAGDAQAAAELAESKRHGNGLPKATSAR